MTIAISLKVNDGLVLAADSASTLMARDGGVVNVYNNAIKVFNLYKGLPIGAITWGSGGIGSASISTLAKDFRRRLMGQDPQKKNDWVLNRDSYTILDVAQKLKQFIYDENYQLAFKDWPQKPVLGFIIAGYSSGENMAEEYQIDIGNGSCSEPRLIHPKDASGIAFNGEIDAIHRLIKGCSIGLPVVLEKHLGVKKEEIPPIMNLICGRLQIALIEPAMPFQDAIDLAEFLIDLTIKFSRFKPGAPTVGGPIELAAISKHEGFKWISRKHYYDRQLNPEICPIQREEEDYNGRAI